MLKGKDNEKRSLEEEILAPYNHLIQVRGKQLREKIVRSFNYWFELTDAQLKESVGIMTLLHQASVLLDDVQDNSSIRRGLPSAHCVYGVPLTLNASAQIMMKAAKKALQLVPSGEGGFLLIDQFYNALTGQGFEIYWRDSSLCPSEAEYYKMLKLKTGRMLLLGVKLMQLLSDNKQNYDDFVKNIGLYLQLRDDYCSMGHEEALEEMPGEEDIMANTDEYIYEDITEGKFTLPTIHAMGTPEGPPVLNIMRKRTRNLELKKYCLGLLEKSGSLQYTRDMLSKVDRDLRAELARLGGNPLLEEVLDNLLSWKDDKLF